MLGAGAIIAVRQKHDQTRLDVPLGLTGSHKLIDHDLSTVSKVTELGLPEAEGVGVRLSVTLFETEDGVLG